MCSLNFDSAYFRKLISKCALTEFIPSVNQLLLEGSRKFYNEFDYHPNVAICAPGTFNIMGEYMELGGGLMVQAAMPLVTLILARWHECLKCRVLTCAQETDEPRRVIFPVPRCTPLKKGFPKWANLLKGVMNTFMNTKITGYDALIHSNIPMCRGFGSSAAIEAALYALMESGAGDANGEEKACKAKKCRLADEKFGETTSGSVSSYTCFFADTRDAVVINTGFRDPNILFLLTLPKSDLLRHPPHLIRMRETELKLAARLLGLNDIKYVRECHLEVLSSMEDPTKAEVISILHEFEKDEEYIKAFVDELFKLPSVEVALSYEDLVFGGEELYMANSFTDNEKSLVEPVFDGEFTEFEYKTICDETICLGGLSDLSARSDLTVISKLIRRVRYVVTENRRIRSLMRFVTDLDFVSAGLELTRSHLSLKVDFEVSSPVLDDIVKYTVELKNGVYGSKMTRHGGTVTLVHRNHIDEIIGSITDRFGADFNFYLVFPSRGIRKVKVMPQSVPKSFLSDTYANVEELMVKAVTNFEATYRRYPTHGCFAPGAIMVLGDHSDYNQTYSLPMALNMGTIVVGALNGTGKIRVVTTADIPRQPQRIMFQIPSVQPLVAGSVKWANYVKGIVSYFHGPVPGFDCLIESSIPMGSRISSSASLQIALYSFLEEVTGNRSKNKNEKTTRCMQAEHDFTNTLCGNDDFIVAMNAVEDKMLIVDCKKCTFKYLPSFDPSLVYLLIYKESLSKPSKSLHYVRLEQCYDVARALGLKSLRCVKEEELEGLQGVSEVAIKRARHILSEKKRVLAGAKALRELDPEKFGHLMVQSHISLRDLFEVSCRELDLVVEKAMEVDGVLGARMTGSEYGSSVICLIKKWAADNVIEYIREMCVGDFNFYLLTPSSGLQRLDIRGYVDSLPGPKHTFERIFHM